ncbi:MAG: hypothetical protein K2Y22_14880 [Candidatus Obscuribacterales bacterium]|nr:hypothetical protein [Candidatus Obscuribacterales bacterium]
MSVFKTYYVSSYKFKFKCVKGTQILSRLLVRDNRVYLTMLEPEGVTEKEYRYFNIIGDGDKLPEGVDAKVIDSYVGPNGYFNLLYEYTPKSVQRKRRKQ